MPLDLLEKDLYRCFPNLGTSVHSIGQLRKAESFGVSYVTAGHIFTTDCKKDLAPRGLGFLSDVNLVILFGYGQEREFPKDLSFSFTDYSTTHSHSIVPVDSL